MIAQAHGHDRGTAPLGAPQVFRIEPHQPEVCGFVPDLLLDVSPVWERKMAAMRLPGRFWTRCSGGRPPRDAGVLRGGRNT